MLNTTPDKLSTVVTAFESWRNNRNGRQVSTPITLREQAVSLLNNYSSSKITSALRISGSQLKQWKNALIPPEQTPQFVHLPILPSPTQVHLNVELRFASGDQMCISGGIDRDMITAFIGEMKS